MKYRIVYARPKRILDMFKKCFQEMNAHFWRKKNGSQLITNETSNECGRVYVFN